MSAETAEARVARVFSSLFPRFRAPMLNQERLCENQEQDSTSPLVHISITPTEEIVAYSLAHTTPGEIVLSKGLVQEVSDAELRFVLAHEMGHIIAGHVAIDLSDLVLSKRQLAKIKNIRKRWEFEADRFAFQHVQQPLGSKLHSGHSVLAYLSVHKAKQNIEVHQEDTQMAFEHQASSFTPPLQSALKTPKQIDLRIAVLDSLHHTNTLSGDLGL